MPKIVRLKDCAGEFLTRRQGEKLRKQLVQVYEELPPAESLAIDFVDVDIMTPSFADECFGKLAERLGAQNFRQFVALIGADPTIRALVNAVLTERMRPPGTEVECPEPGK